MVQIRFIAQPGFVSDAIKVVSRAPSISHVEFLTPEGTYIGAHAPGGIQERPASYCVPVWERRYSLPATEDASTALIAEARSLIGTKYDLADILGLVFQSGLHDPTRLICSEFVYRLLAKHVRLMLNVLPDHDYAVTPEMLHLSPYLIGHCTYSNVGS